MPARGLDFTSYKKNTAAFFTAIHPPGVTWSDSQLMREDRIHPTFVCIVSWLVTY